MVVDIDIDMVTESVVYEFGKEVGNILRAP